MSQFESLRLDHGPFAPIIFSQEPKFAEGEECPVPTGIEITNPNGQGFSFRQKLNAGRFVALYAGGEQSPKVQREWVENDAYTDTLAGNGQRVLTSYGEGTWRLETPDQRADLWRFPGEHGSTILQVATRGILYSAQRVHGGKLAYEEQQFVEKTKPGEASERTVITKHTYRDTNLLNKVTVRRQGEQSPHAIETYTRGPQVVTVEQSTVREGIEKPILRQTREYDDEGRVVEITLGSPRGEQRIKLAYDS
ncbi:MAG TPA: hypothetical protein VK674_04520 [Candidatus Limnocylindria bacterium]|nr:hypothetical protein [Candidatus Limnocylindria bacterium]